MRSRARDALKPPAAAIALLLAGALCMPAAGQAQQVAIETHGQGESITVTASAEMRVDPRTVWSVITDYDHLAEFIPFMRSSRVVRRAPPTTCWSSRRGSSASCGSASRCRRG